MRVLPILTVLLIAIPVAGWSQDRPLYNSRSISGPTVGATPLYNSGATGGQPLSLNQITQGKNNAGYSFERGGTGFNPYNPSNYSGTSEAAVEAFRAERAAQAQSAEQQALSGIASGHQDSINNPAIFNNVTGQGAGVPVYTNVVDKKKQKYEGRDLGLTVPPKVFNSVR